MADEYICIHIKVKPNLGANEGHNYKDLFNHLLMVNNMYSPHFGNFI